MTKEKRDKMIAQYRQRRATYHAARIARLKKSKRPPILDVVDAARDAVAILQGNHPAGAFANPAEVAEETLTAALVALDSREVQAADRQGRH